jgi:hypothetical protein
MPREKKAKFNVEDKLKELDDKIEMIIMMVQDMHEEIMDELVGGDDLSEGKEVQFDENDLPIVTKEPENEPATPL